MNGHSANIHAAAEDEAAGLSRIIDSSKAMEGPLLPILHAVQAEFGYIPEGAKQHIADDLNLSRAEVHGVVTFYNDFRDHPPGRHVLRLCRAEACQSMGCESLATKLRAMLGIDWHETTADGAITLEPVYCLGLCASSPVAMLDGAVVGRVDERRLNDIVEDVCR